MSLSIKRSKNQLIILICILISFVLWLPTKLSKNYSRDINVSILIVPPEGMALTTSPPTTFPLRIVGTGSQLISMSRRLLKDTLIYRLPPKTEQYTLSVNEFIEHINKSYDAPAGLTITSPVNSYRFELDSLIRKKVIIRSGLQMTFKDNFGLYDVIHLSPDSVELEGANSIVSNIHHASTEKYRLSDLEQVIDFESTIINPYPDIIELSSKVCTIHIPVSELTEKELQVPVGLTEGALENFRLFPNTISVVINVPLKIYNTIEAAEIQLELSPQGKNAYSVQVKGLPENTAYISHRPRIVRYLKTVDSDTTSRSE